MFKKKVMKKITFCFYVLLVYASLASASRGNMLKSISVVFRHGDRTPENYPTESYPNDPYFKELFGSIGRGSLTNAGKKRVYELGAKLRELYHDFLSDEYKSSEVFAISTPVERTEMSLLLILAGLYPPIGEQMWSNDLRWQPIPIKVVGPGIPNFSYPEICPLFLNELKRVKETDEYKRDLSCFDELKKNLTMFTGRNMSELHDLYYLFLTLTTESNMNLALPKWTKSYFPNGPLLDAALFQYQTQSYTTTLKKLNGGLFVRKILDDNFYKKKSKSTKLFLYSVHESNIAGLRQTLNLWNNIVPAYGSAIIIEFYLSQSEYFLRFLHFKGTPPELESQIIPGCDEFCSLNDFILILADVIPNDTVESCIGPPENSLLIPKDMDPNVWIYEKMKEWFNI